MRSLMKEILLPVAVAVALAFVIQEALAKPYEIPTGSMIPTIQERDRIIANRIVYRLREPERGDVIVFNPSEAARGGCDAQANVPFVKRVIGLPGDRVRVRGHVAFVNGERFEVPAARTGVGFSPADFPENPEEQPILVPPRKLFVLGDNRPFSCDSRSWSGAPFVDRDQVIGQAEVIYWPPSHLTFLK